MKYYPASGLTFTKSKIPATRSTTITVNVDGACPSNGNSPTVATWGVYFGRNSQYNSCGLLPPDSKITNNVAEIYAALQSLKLVSQKVVLGPREIKEVIIISDSAWLVNSMTSYIDKWRQNGYINSKRQPVFNAELIQELDDLIEDVDTTLGLSVKFWHVERKHNHFADRLANIPLAHPAITWSTFWEQQLTEDPKISLSDLLSFRPNAVESSSPRILCLSYPLTGKGEYMSSLRAFLIIQSIWKTKGFPDRPSENEGELRDELLEAILGPLWRKRANAELEKHKFKIGTQNELFSIADGKLQGGDEGKRKFVVRAQVNNHAIMGVVCKSLEGMLPFSSRRYLRQADINLAKTRHFSFAEQDLHYDGLANKYLHLGPRGGKSKAVKAVLIPGTSRASSSDPRNDLLAGVRGLTLEPEVARDRGARNSSRKAKKNQAKKETTPAPMESSGVRLDWQARDEWTEIQYSSSSEGGWTSEYYPYSD